ncbi:phosphomannomutase [Desulfuromonas thiophila]|uniref:Phosphomannomutase n=1 Tax=Desulfuromonas thiophila TaxID=57664 RepID=A0A1G6Z0V4_9BACT|nr:phosphomannomutase [Desulfuromonas thiophila]MDD3802359.1 phosphomannomutase [Desulfuromonas thiophila]SDD95505.1 phosphomannomutase [Desulfuromonas thiophila]
MNLTCFKAYDIRGRIPDELDEEVVYRIGRAYAEFVRPQRVVVGHDVRLTSPLLSQALCLGLTEAGVDVYDIGLCGTEEVYFATFHEQMDGGIMITASHNPMDYNGLKLVRQQAQPISADTGLQQIRQLAEAGDFEDPHRFGNVEPLDVRAAYINHLLTYVDSRLLPQGRIVVNAGNGCAGPVLDALAPHLPCELVRVNHQPDGRFPNGIPNPLLPENRSATAQAVLDHQALAGIAWDGDFDRCFLFDEKGQFIEGYYIVGLLAEAFLAKYPGAKIVHDPRLVWNTLDIVAAGAGQAVESKSGHAFIKERMRLENAVYGGEMSAHHYFRDFSYCDSGMIPWLLVLELIARSGKPLSQLVAERIAAYPASGEINREVQQADAALQALKAHYRDQAQAINEVDGLGMDFGRWRFNLRSSNTEPVVRLNVESRADVALMEQKTRELLLWLDSWNARCQNA